MSQGKKIHFVGIGGIGMSGIAHVLLKSGHEVSGSDVRKSHITEKLESIGGRIYEGHRAQNLARDVGVLVYSSSISADNPEIVEAVRRKIRLRHRAQMLGEIFNKKMGIAVTGTHGKTTTASLVSVMMKNAFLDPTVIIGGEVPSLGGNAAIGNGQHVVAEADESDSSFIHLKPYYAVMTNLEMEHPDHFKSLAHICRSFGQFAGNLKKGGTIFYNNDDKNLKKVLAGFSGNKESFGFSRGSDMTPSKIKLDGFETSFDCVYKSRRLGRISVNIPGRHNVANTMAAVLVGLKAGLRFDSIAQALKGFGGAKRRFELRSIAGGVMLIEDYAHHPTEIKAVISACRSWKHKRLVVVFQPHRYTRTKFLVDDFGRCFKGADKLILTDIYAASEKPIDGVSAGSIYDKVTMSGLKKVVIMKKERIARHLVDTARRGDMILVLGAGDIKKVADEAAFRMGEGLVEELKKMMRGKVRQNENLSAHTSFRIGGPAKIWVEPADTADLKRLLGFVRRNNVPFFLMGNGSNILASDKGFDGIVASMKAGTFKKLRIKSAAITVGAGFSLPRLIRIACEKSLGGLESMVGIPGTIGGAVYMNAGGYANSIYGNMSKLVTSVKVMDRLGRIKELSAGKLGFGYRRSDLDGYVILEVSLGLSKARREDLLSSMSRFLSMKREKQILDIPSAGCLFKNPQGAGLTCGQMIDMLGLKGKRIGGAEVSKKHANFIINRSGAKCEDVLALADFIKKKVMENYGVGLDLEVKLL